MERTPLRSKIERLSGGPAEALRDRITNRTAVIGVIGLGYVGLPLILRFSEMGYGTIGFDIDKRKINMLQSGQSYLSHISSDRVASRIASKRAIDKTAFLTPTTDFRKVTDADVLILCVPTPLNRNREPDLTFIRRTMESILPRLRPRQLLSLESTTYPGTTEEEIAAPIEEAGFRIGSEMFVVYSPEREDPGNAVYKTQNTPKICSGITDQCADLGSTLYYQVVEEVITVSSTRTAEMTKLLENIYRSVNIGLVNELKTVTERMGIDIREVIDAAATKPFGFTPFYPGPGLGGHCIPIDPFYLTWKAREFGVHTRFIELAGEVNSNMPGWVVSKIADALNRHSKPLKESKILILGLAYKKNVGDTRETPAAEIMDVLLAKGAMVSYSDPFVPSFPKKRDYQLDLESVDLSPELLSQMDCAVVVTDHDAFPYDMILEHSQLIVDSRGVYRNGAEKVVHA